MDETTCDKNSVKPWVFLCLACMGLTGCMGFYIEGPYLSPGSISSSFDHVDVTYNSGLEIFIQDERRDLPNLQLIEATATDKKGVTQLHLLKKINTTTKPHAVFITLGPAPQTPFDLHLEVLVGNERCTLDAHYSGHHLGQVVTWKQLE